MIDAVDVLILLTLHYLADFECQNDWMANNKAKSWRALSAHVGVYTMVLTAGMLAWASISLIPASVFPIRMVEVIGWQGIAAFAVATFVTHFVTDAVTSRITSRLWFFKQEPGLWKCVSADSYGTCIDNPWMPVVGGNLRHRFFCVIGFDQLIHAWTLTLTWAVVTG